MPYINELNESDQVDDDDFVPLWDSSAGATRKSKVSNIRAPHPTTLMNYQALDVYMSAASYSIPTTATVLVCDTETRDSEAIYNNTTGVITIPRSALYTFTTILSATTSSGVKTIYTWAESSIDGVSWTKSATSGRLDIIKNAEDRIISFPSINLFAPAGLMVRIMIKTSAATASLQTVNIPGETGVFAPAARLMVGSHYLTTV